MTILVAHQIIGAPNLKHFYQKIIWQYHRREFPGLISYSRFIGITAIAVVPLTLYLRFRMEMSRHTGLSVIDSTPLRVCMNLRIPRHQVFKGLAGRGKILDGLVLWLQAALGDQPCGRVDECLRQRRKPR